MLYISGTEWLISVVGYFPEQCSDRWLRHVCIEKKCYYYHHFGYRISYNWRIGALEKKHYKWKILVSVTYPPP